MYWKKSNCRLFSYLKTLAGSKLFRHTELKKLALATARTNLRERPCGHALRLHSPVVFAHVHAKKVPFCARRPDYDQTFENVCSQYFIVNFILTYLTTMSQPLLTKNIEL